MPHAQPSPPSKPLAQPLTSQATDAGAASPGQSQFSLTLMQARLSRGWTQLQLADLIGTTSQTVSRWERGAATPGLYHRHKLCALFGLSLAELGWSVEAGTENEASITDGNEAGQAPESSNTGISSDTGQLLADKAGPLASQAPLPPSAPAGLSETGKHVSEQARVTASPIRPVQYRRRKRLWHLFVSSCLGIVLASTFGLIALNWFWPAAPSSPVDPSKPPSLPLSAVGTIAFLSSDDVAGNSAQGMNDEVAIYLPHVPAPPPGTSYVAWMTAFSGSEAIWTPLGRLAWTPISAPVSASTPHTDKGPETGTASLFSASPQHTNLLVTFNRFLITQEAMSIPPQQPSSAWVYTASISAIATPGDPNHYSLLDHLRHLLAADPSLAALGIKGGLVSWLTGNTGQVALEASQLETDWHTHRFSDLRQHLLRILDYLDGNTGVQADLPADTPRFLPLPFARVGLLTLLPDQEPPQSGCAQPHLLSHPSLSGANFASPLS